ncbi:RusA family crossover junction endodeoxyribonuclease [Atopobacter phocae]|uniref:RusA family crossover junction endodeoxyribonuclease n=1 Tax=Atopobacter phocae TaxID=136492 RepID=UPI00046FC711|nr:RusA family crossover junction endodeoxyribonuclease [Atopobacter phocae]
MIELSIDIEPVAQGRPRFTRQGHTYDPPKSKAFKRQIKTFFLKEKQRNNLEAIDGPIEIELTFYKPLLKSMTIKQKTQALLKQLLPIKKPDLDNYIKGVLDGMNGIFWHDDAQIVKLMAYKYYGDKGCIDIKIKSYKHKEENGK